jgi:hypothetical protein
LLTSPVALLACLELVLLVGRVPFAYYRRNIRFPVPLVPLVPLVFNPYRLSVQPLVRLLLKLWTKQQPKWYHTTHGSTEQAC